MKVVHFITNDKFLAGTIKFLDGIEELDNHYLIYTLKKRAPKIIESERVQRADDALIKEIISNPNFCDVIIIHNLISLPCKYIKEIDKRIKVVWFSFGSDVFNNSYPQFPLIKIRNLIKPETLDFYNWILHYSKTFIKEYVFRLLRVKAEEHKAFMPAIHRIDYYSGVFPIEYELIKKSNTFFRAKKVSYYYVSDVIKTLYREDDIYRNLHPTGNNIQVGNSASVFGNHRNTLNKLSKLNIDNRKVITPLSYSGAQTYVSSVCRYGYRLFGDNFIPLLSLMQRDDYFKLLNSVSHAIYNIEREGAVGNIKMGLWSGVKIFLPKDSMDFLFFKQQGFFVYTIEEDMTQEELDCGLTDEQIVHNRLLLNKTTSYEVVREKVVSTFNMIQEDIEKEKNN